MVIAEALRNPESRPFLRHFEWPDSHGWIPYEQKFPQKFVDAEGTEYEAMPDFIHGRTGFYDEFKAHRMNGNKTKRAAMAKIDDDIAKGFLE